MQFRWGREVENTLKIGESDCVIMGKENGEEAVIAWLNSSFKGTVFVHKT